MRAVHRSNFVMFLLISTLVIGWGAAAETSKSKTDREREAVAQAIDDSIGWFKTKDFDLLFRVHAAGPDLFLYHPDAGSTIHSGEEFRKHSEVWKNPKIRYLSHEVKKLRIQRAQRDDVAWFSTFLDDCAEFDGRKGCWENARWTGVLEKREGQWVMVQGHFSFPADPAKEEIPLDEIQRLAGQSTDSISPSGVFPQIEAVIQAGFSWAKTKDIKKLYSTRSQDEDLFIWTPYSNEPVVGFKAFRAQAENSWLKDSFKAKGYDIRDLRIHLSRGKRVAWFSAVVSDWCEIDGKPSGWHNVRWTGVLEKRHGKWLYVQGHFSMAQKE